MELALKVRRRGQEERGIYGLKYILWNPRVSGFLSFSLVHYQFNSVFSSLFHFKCYVLSRQHQFFLGYRAPIRSTVFGIPRAKDVRICVYWAFLDLKIDASQSIPFMYTARHSLHTEVYVCACVLLPSPFFFKKKKRFWSMWMSSKLLCSRVLSVIRTAQVKVCWTPMPSVVHLWWGAAKMTGTS